MSFFQTVRALYSEQWLIAESHQVSLYNIAEKFLEKGGFDEKIVTGNPTFSFGEKWNQVTKDYRKTPHLLPNGVLLMPLQGVLFKEDVCYSAGMDTIGQWYEMALTDPQVKAIVEVVYSPGGQASGTPQLANVKAKVKEVKPIVEFVNDMMCSAALWIGSASNYIIASSSIDTIGSLGAMITYNKQTPDPNRLTVYSKTSEKKNHAFREADKGNTKPLQEMATEMDAKFMEFVQLQRPNITQEALDGTEFFTSDAIANGICDAQGTLQDAIDKALSLVGETPKDSEIINFSINTTDNDMQFSPVKLGTLMGSLGLSATKADNTEKNGDEILSELNTKFGEMKNSLQTTQKERDDAVAAKTQLETEKKELETQVAELQKKVGEKPAQKPAATNLQKGDKTEDEKEQDEEEAKEFSSIAFAKSLGIEFAE